MVISHRFLCLTMMMAVVVMVVVAIAVIIIGVVGITLRNMVREMAIR